VIVLARHTDLLETGRASAQQRLLPTLLQLGMANSLSVRLDLGDLSVPEGATELCDDPARLWLGWGDWNVIAAVHSRNLERVLEVARETSTTVTPIGRLSEGPPDVLLSRASETVAAPRLESERFAKDSWFEAGIQGYMDLLMRLRLPGLSAGNRAPGDSGLIDSHY